MTPYNISIFVVTDNGFANADVIVGVINYPFPPNDTFTALLRGLNPLCKYLPEFIVGLAYFTIATAHRTDALQGHIEGY